MDTGTAIGIVCLFAFVALIVILSVVFCNKSARRKEETAESQENAPDAQKGDLIENEDYASQRYDFDKSATTSTSISPKIPQK